MRQQDKLALHKMGWVDRPIVAIIDVDKEHVWTKKHTYPFRDLSQTAIQHFIDQTVVNGVPMQRIKIDNHLLSLHEHIMEDNMGEVIRSGIDEKPEKFDSGLNLLKQAFDYEMFLVCELERRTQGQVSKDELIKVASSTTNNSTSFVDAADIIMEEAPFERKRF